MSGDTSNDCPAPTGQLQGATPARADFATRFKPGQSGNPAGRSKSCRNKLSEAFIAALNDDFAEHGPAVISQVRAEMPHVYLKVIASLVPKELKLDKEHNSLADFTDDELMAIVLSVSKMGNEGLQ
jgi:hypothetical protein